MTTKVANVLMDSRVTGSTPVTMWMNARRSLHANVLIANARTPGGVTNATAGTICCTCTSMTLASVKRGVSSTRVSWSFAWFIFFGLAAAGAGGYALYKYRIRRYMDSEIRAIMAQYMPLDNHGGGPKSYVPWGHLNHQIKYEDAVTSKNQGNTCIQKFLPIV